MLAPSLIELSATFRDSFTIFGEGPSDTVTQGCLPAKYIIEGPSLNIVKLSQINSLTGPLLVHNLLQVGEPLPVQLGDGLVPEPVGVVGHMRQGAVSAELLVHPDEGEAPVHDPDVEVLVLAAPAQVEVGEAVEGLVLVPGDGRHPARVLVHEQLVLEPVHRLGWTTILEIGQFKNVIVSWEVSEF